MNQTSAKAANYIIAGLAVLGMVFCWLQHFQSKQTLSNLLIPQSLSYMYFRPAILFTVIFGLIILLQGVSIYFRKAHGIAAVFGLAVFFVAGICYPYTVSWFMS